MTFPCPGPDNFDLNMLLSKTSHVLKNERFTLFPPCPQILNDHFHAVHFLAVLHCRRSCMASLGTRDSLCAAVAAAGWSALRCSLGRNSCLPKKGRKDLTAQTSHLHQHMASVLPQHCPDFFLSLDMLPMWACCSLWFSTASVTSEESSLGHGFGGVQIFAYSAII